MEKQVKLFLDFLKDDKKLSDNTLQSYRRDIEQYEKYVSDNKINYLKVTEETILEYMEFLREENKKRIYNFKKLSFNKIILSIFNKS